MTDHESDSSIGNTEAKKGVPVMCCHPVGDDITTGEGPAPSTPRRKDGDVKDGDAPRFTIKKFFRVTPEQNEVIITGAADAGLEQSSYLRVQALGKSRAQRIRKFRIDWKELNRALGVVNKAGSVVNQMVLEIRRFGGRTDKADAAFADLRAVAAVIMAILAGR